MKYKMVTEISNKNWLASNVTIYLPAFRNVIPVTLFLESTVNSSISNLTIEAFNNISDCA